MEHQKRLDLHLLNSFPTLSRTIIKNIVIAGLVTVNGEKVMPNYKVLAKDKIEYSQQKIDQFLKQGNNEKIKPYKTKVEIIYEDNDLIIANKPEDLNSHPVLKNDNKSLLNALYFHLQKNNDNSRIRLVNRLDKETSGIVLATKNLAAHDYYSSLFESRNITKEYLSIVHGDFETYLNFRGQDYIAYTSYLTKDPSEKKKFINTKVNKGKLAKSKIYFVKYFNKFGKKKFSLLKIIPETGRTHQIRVHLSSLGFPILGDRLYGGQKYKRLMLHSYAIKLKLRGQKKIRIFESEIPNKFEG